VATIHFCVADPPGITGSGEYPGDGPGADGGLVSVIVGEDVVPPRRRQQGIWPPFRREISEVMEIKKRHGGTGRKRRRIR